MINYGHFIGGKTRRRQVGTNRGGVPADGRHGARACRARLQGRGSRRGRERQSGAAGLGGGQSAAPRPRDDEVPRPHRQIQRRARRHSGARARQDDRRRQGRHSARRRGGRIRARRAASDEGRIYRRRRPRHRPLFDAPAARRRRRHHAVQFPGDDPVVEARAGDRLRQRLHPEAVGARPRRADAARRNLRRSGRASGHPQRRQRRQGGGRRHPRRSRHSGDRLRRLDPDRRSTSIRAARRRENACSASAAPRTIWW